MIDFKFRTSYIQEKIDNHKNYNIPLNWHVFIDDFGIPISMNFGERTINQARKYFDKLCKFVGNDYKLNYHEIRTDDDLNDISFKSESGLERVIRLICLKHEKFDKDKNLFLGVISLDLSNIKTSKGEQFYKLLLDKIKESENELCNI